jgi:5-methyltetrahydropteroyltriglutamate--homocysteine methyltransferase
MSIKTTCIGAYPKPDYIQKTWWNEAEDGGDASGSAREFDYSFGQPRPIVEDQLDRATCSAVKDQVDCGVDVPTDGEQRRENYIHYHCRHFDGIDFDKLTRKVHRNGAAVANLPTITAKIVPKEKHFRDRDFEVAQSCTERPVKITLPGPVTIIDTTANIHYATERELAFDLADALNVEIRALAEAGCKYIQVDEPLFARKVDAALAYGIECLERCFDGLPDDVTRIMHMCCGYPGHLDDEDYEKAPPENYGMLASALDESRVDCISIEDAHRHNDLGLLELFPKSTVIFGSIAIASTHIEPVEEIADRLASALNHIDRDRLIAAPDCGLMMLGRDLAMTKLKNLCEAARLV